MKKLHAVALCALSLSISSAFAATNWSLGNTYRTTAGDCDRGNANTGANDLYINANATGDMARLANGNTCRIQGRDSGTGNITATTGDNVMVSAWATTNQVNNSTTMWEDAKLKGWLGSGFGVTNRDAGAGDANEGTAPEHAVDNNERIDGVLYTFTQNFALKSLTLGWTNTDADLAVFRFAGTGVPPQLSTTTAGGLIGAGWEHVGNYADVGANTTLNLQNTGNVASSWWLVTAYNPIYGGNQKKTGNLTASNDYFKLLTVSGDLKVSEPAVLALAGLGLAGVLLTRRRRVQPSAA